MVRLMSWNVNGIRAAAEKGLFDWVAASKADIICLQETKAQPDQLGPQFFEIPGGYEPHWASAVKKGYSGTAIYTRVKPKTVTFLGEAAYDNEGRVLMADYGDFVLFNCYFPNSQDAGARLDYKLGFCNALKKKTDELVKAGKHIVVCGDYNIAHKPIDLTHPKANEGNAGYLPEERAWMDEFTAAGYIDTFRSLHAEPKNYSWWSYRANARANNVGWRIDYFCTDAGLGSRIKEASIHPEVYGSDHCPIGLELDF